MAHTHRRAPLTSVRNTLTLLTAAGLLAVAACNGGPGTEPTDPANTDEPSGGGSLTIATIAINSLDPQGTSAGSAGTGTVAKALFSTLVVVEDGELVGDLALDWESSEDGVEWTFALNPDATFSDGSPVTAADVDASLERVRELGGPYASLFNGLESSSAPDDHTWEVTTTSGGTLLYALSLLYIAPAESIDDDAFWQDPIGSGPFVLESFAPGERVTVTRNEAYWGEASSLDAVEFVYIPEVSGQVTALATGDIDIAINLPQDQITTVESYPDVSVVMSEPTTISTFWFNNSVEPLDDVRVRQALWHAVDWESIREDLYGETALPASAPIASGVFGHTPQEPYAYDVERAEELLADAGHDRGLSLTLKFNPAGGLSQAQSLVDAAISYWAAVGVQVTAEPQEQAVYLEDLLALNWDITPLANTSRTADADQILGRLYVSSANRLGFADEDVDRLLAEAAAAADPDVRLQAYAEVNRILWENAVAIWPMEFTAVYAVSDRVIDFTPDPSSVPSFHTVRVASD